jgi:flagellar brake protein
MGMTHPFPEPESPELERCAVYSRVEMLAIGRSLRDAGVLVTAYFDGEPGFAVTTLLEVEEEAGVFVFDQLAEPLLQRRLLGSAQITFVGFVEAIKLQFSVAGARDGEYDGRPAFRVPLPERALRMQRREFFRVRPPTTKPATCSVPYGEDQAQVEILRVLDISVGGMAVLTYPEKFDLVSGRVFEGCELDLPGIGKARVSVRVRHIDPVARDEKARRAGCEFAGMAPAASLLVQRYVNKLDADSRKLAGRG